MLKMGLLKKYVFTHCQPFPIQDWLSSDPQDMKELLDKLTQQNQQLAQLEAQIQVRICSCDINYAVFLLYDVMNKRLLFVASSCAEPDFYDLVFVFHSQKEQLDSAASGDKKGKAGLENENAKLEEELSSLPELKEELEILRATVTELSQLTGITGQT